jgi:hypothetical protein
MMELASDVAEYKGIWLCVSREKSAHHFEDWRIGVDEGLPGWCGPL